MEKHTNNAAKVLFLLMVFAAGVEVSGQTRPRKTAPKRASASAQAKAVEPVAVPAVTVPQKKNERPADAQSQERANKRPSSDAKTSASFEPAYHYEFAQPEFTISKIVIEHDEAGKGSLSFMKNGYDEPVTDPIQLSEKALAKINDALTNLNFLASSENYQYEKDFSHLGTVIFHLAKDGKKRDTTFNWTQNKDAKILMDEYRRIGNQFVWIFDITLARENQPLNAPKLMDSLDSMISRNEISDPNQMIPFLQTLVNDERIPLISRNHAEKLIKKLQKEKK